ncbi:MAG: hypothetical protein EAZ37_16315 [Burkholderiales bacterium]|nr:MAG: hypothetical protein EAZ43_04210 [Betaproteobacteria bacterium]TAG24443.1 MAG: hypothetical protein EAZ37_16315 [Burkholderiales bacterium]TAG45898.1 MAG: hypothetical protein EAZ30_14310 [Betaproteobacteria bacterium]
MSLLSPNIPPSIEHHDTLREWRLQPFSKRYWVAVKVMARVVSFVVLLAGIALLIAEPSVRSLILIALMWLVGVPLTALGYVRKMDRLAAQAPALSPRSSSPTTTIDIRQRRVD